MSDNRAALREQLRQGCERVPVEKFQVWSHGQTVAFKRAIQEGRKILGNPRASESALSAAINKLANFWL